MFFVQLFFPRNSGKNSFWLIILREFAPVKFKGDKNSEVRRDAFRARELGECYNPHVRDKLRELL